MGKTRAKSKPSSTRTKDVRSPREAKRSGKRIAEISVAAGDPLQPAGLAEYLKIVEAENAKPLTPGAGATGTRTVAEASRATKSRRKK